MSTRRRRPSQLYEILVVDLRVLLSLVLHAHALLSLRVDVAFAASTAGGFDGLVEWMIKNGGRVDKRFGIGPFSNEGGTYRGALALEDIAAGTEILFCPWSCVLGTEGNTANVPTDHCAVLRNYAQEVAAGKDSFFYEYLSIDDSLGTRIPLLWGEAATKELQGLPPSSPDEIKQQEPTLKDWFCENCAGGKSFDTLDKPTQQSFMAVVTRAAGMRFMPIFDMLNHHNGLMNVISSATVDGNSLTTTRDIAAGEEIFHSFRGGRELSSDILRRYGFIEDWPRQWAWVDSTTLEEERFLLMPNGSVTIDPPEKITSRIGEGSLSISEINKESDHHNSDLLTDRLTRFSEAGRRLLASLPTTAENDVIILAELKERQSTAPYKSDQEMLQIITDQMFAVRYRIQFKEGIQIAINSVEKILLSRQSGGGKEL